MSNPVDSVQFASIQVMGRDFLPGFENLLYHMLTTTLLPPLWTLGCQNIVYSLNVVR